MSACCLGNDGGLCSPQTPGSRGIPPAPFLRRGKRFLPNFFSHVGWETKENAHTTGRPTGAMKTKKKPGEKARFLLRPFSIVFPGCKSIRPAVFHTAQPVACSAASQFAKRQSSFRKRFSAWRKCRSQLAKTQSSFAKACVRVALQHRHIACKIHIAISGTGSRGDAPCGGGGGKAPPWSPQASPGNCLFDTNCHVRRKGTGRISLAC